MASVNVSRSVIAQNVTDAVKDAKLIAFNNDGEACVWFGGTSAYVYDAARDWSRGRALFLTEVAAMENTDTDEALNAASQRMEDEGFKTI